MLVERNLIVNNESGLHARPATNLVRLAQKFESETYLYNAENETIKADCKSVLALLSLGAIKGTKLILRSSGADASAAIEEVSGFFKRNFDEQISTIVN
jgi:phosphotransferase system HPr (HPr) family protein